MAHEVELKYEVPGMFTFPDLRDPDHGVEEVSDKGSLRLRATYYDTPDLRLARHGVTLRYRTGEGRSRWTLKLPVADQPDHVRDEIDAPGSAAHVPDDLRSLTTGWVRTGALGPVTTLVTERRVRELLDSDGVPIAEVVDDTVSVMEGRRLASRFREIELERSGISDRAVAEASARLVAAGAMGGEFTPKVIRALGPHAKTPDDLPADTGVGPSHPAGDALRAALRNGAVRLLGSDLGVRRREDDAVHQMRVACRRMRSDLRTFAPLVDHEWSQALRTDLKWLADALGGPRDLEVLRARLQATAAADSLAPLDAEAVARIDAVLATREEGLLAELDEALRSPRYAALLDAVVDAAARPQLTELAERPSSQALPPLVAATWDKLRRKAKKLSRTGSDHSWHRVRITSKKARYAAEAVAPSLGHGASRFAAAARDVQEVLGEHQDAAVAGETWLDVARAVPGDVELALAAGRLAERERQAIVAQRRAFPKVLREIHRKGALRWMDR